MHMMENACSAEWDTDYRGKTVIVASHLLVSHIEQIRADLRPFIVRQGTSLLRVTGFILGTLVDRSVSDQYWVQFPWSESPIQIRCESVIRILLDDEGEPERVNGLPRLVYGTPD